MTTLCESCVPQWGDFEIIAVPISACAGCGRADVRRHVFRSDPRLVSSSIDQSAPAQQTAPLALRAAAIARRLKMKD